MNFRVWSLLFLVLLGACTGVPVKQGGPGNKAAYLERADKLKLIDEWGLAGRISLDDGDQGGSGKLRWMVTTGRSQLDFHAAMGRGAWQLKSGPDGAVLTESNGTKQTAPGVNELIQQRMGWPIPVGALQWWVRGLAAPGGVDQEEIGLEGLLANLHQFGWYVEFSRYDSVTDVVLPVRLEARRDNYRVKLAISRWQFGSRHEPEAQ